MPLILVVEDEEELRENVAEELRDWDFDVAEAGNGADALAQARERRPDLILTDIMMPRMTGPELFSAARADAGLAGVPFLFMSALSSQQGIESLPESERRNLIAKPFDFDDLVNAVKSRVSD